MVTGELRADTLKLPITTSKVNAAIKGNQSGTHRIDLASNMLISTEFDMRGAGMIQMMGRDVPIKFSATIRVKKL
jgi:hypothetical protein